MMVARLPVNRRCGCELLRAQQVMLRAAPRGCAWPPSPALHLVAHSAAIVHLREVGRSHRRDCISIATGLVTIARYQ